MKLRNKKTGEIVELTKSKFVNYDIHLSNFNSLKEINDEWEDVEEVADDYWYISCDGFTYLNCQDSSVTHMAHHMLIGNSFETKEEAEQAVEKLKAWKRLKEKGLEIKGWKFTPDMKHIKGNFIKIEAEIPYIQENMKDLDLLFGDEE